MSASMQESWPGKRDCGALTWNPGGGNHKGERKRQREDEQEPRPLNKRFKPSTLDDEEDPKPSGYLFYPRATDVSQSSLSLETPKVSLVDLTANGDVLPKSHSSLHQLPLQNIMFASASIPLQYFFRYYLISIAVLDGRLYCVEDYTANEESVLIVDTSLACGLPNCDLHISIPPTVGMEISLRPIDVHLDRQDRIHLFLLPVPFRSGSCVVLVGPSHPRWIPSWRLPYIVSPPLASDSAMYLQVWPEVKRGASVIVR